MLLIPLTEDDWANAEAIQHENWTISVDYLSESTLQTRILDLMANLMYEINIKKVSGVFCKQMDDSLRETLKLIDTIGGPRDKKAYAIFTRSLIYAFAFIVILLCFYQAVKCFKKIRLRSSYERIK